MKFVKHEQNNIMNINTIKLIKPILICIISYDIQDIR